MEFSDSVYTMAATLGSCLVLILIIVFVFTRRGRDRLRRMSVRARIVTFTLVLVIIAVLYAWPLFDHQIIHLVSNQTSTPISSPVVSTVPPATAFAPVLPTAEALCEAAHSEPIVAGSPESPTFFLIKPSGRDSESLEKYVWFEGQKKYGRPVPFMAMSPEEAKTLVCIESKSIPAVHYTDGEYGYAYHWNVRILSWPNGKVLTTREFRGSDPPVIKQGTGPRYGGSPRGNGDFREWLMTSITDKTIINVGCEIRSLAFSPDGKILASGCFEDYSVKLWSVETGQLITTFEGHTKWVNDLAFSPDGRTLISVSGDETVRLWDVTTGQETFTLRVNANSGALSPDGSTLALGSESSVKLWDLATRRYKATLRGHEKWVSDLAFSPDGRNLVSASGDHTAILWDIATSKKIRVFRGHTNFVFCTAFSPDGSILVTGSFDHSIKYWDQDTGQQIQTLGGHKEGIHDVLFSPSGKILASASNDNTIRLWNAATGKELGVLRWHVSAVYVLAFSPDGKLLASGSSDKTIKLWNLNAEDLGAGLAP